jgi:ABC-2 type transport system permease protein
MRYFKLLAIFYKNSLITELEYRVQFWSNIGLSLFWLAWASVGSGVFFFHTDQIAGWSYHEVLVVVGLFFTVNGFRQMLIQPNLTRLSQYVQMGTLDYILVRPVNSLFLVSLRNIGVHNWGDPLLGMGLVCYAFLDMGRAPGGPEIALFMLLLIAALLILYSLNLLLQTTTIWLVNIERADAVAWSLLEAGRYPVDFYKGWVRSLLTVVVPVAFLTTFPAQALLGRLDNWAALVAPVLATVLFVVSIGFWQFALRYYTSASS